MPVFAFQVYSVVALFALESVRAPLIQRSAATATIVLVATSGLSNSAGIAIKINALKLFEILPAIMPWSLRSCRFGAELPLR